MIDGLTNYLGGQIVSEQEMIRDAESLRNDLNGCMQERADDVVCHVKSMAATIADQSAELADLRKRLSEATAIVEAADRWVACTSMNEADDAGSALEDLLAARREQSATVKGE